MNKSVDVFYVNTDGHECPKTYRFTWLLDFSKGLTIGHDTAFYVCCLLPGMCHVVLSYTLGINREY